MEGFHQLKHVDFSASSLMTGAFLKGLGGSAGGSQLEVLVLRDCIHLKNVEVTQFLSTILAGDFKHLEYFDISNRKGLASESNGSQASLRCFNTSFIPWDQLREVRPELCLVAEFPARASLCTRFMSSGANQATFQLNYWGVTCVPSRRARNEHPCVAIVQALPLCDRRRSLNPPKVGADRNMVTD